MGLGILLVGVGSLILYLQTPHGMKHLILPVLSSFLPVDMKIDRGRLSITGTLEAKGVRCDVPQQNLALEVDNLHGKLDLVSLALRGKFIIPGLEAQGVRVLWDMTEPGPEEDDGMKARAFEDKAAGEDGEDSGFLPVPFPVSVGKARVEGLELLLLRDGDRRVSVGPARLAVTGLSAGSTAEIRLFAPGTLVTGGVEAYSGSIRQVLKLSQDRAGAVTGVLARGETSMAMAAAGPGENRVFRNELEGRLAKGKLDFLAAEIVGTQGGIRLGSILGSARRVPGAEPASPVEKQEAARSLEAELVLKSLTADFLNPFIASVGHGQVAAGKLDATVNLEQEGNAWHFRTGVQGKGLAVRIQKDAGPSPAVDLSLEQQGCWDTASSRLTVDQAGAKIQSNGRALLAVTLEKPLSLDFDHGEATREPGTAPPAGPGVQLNAKIFRTDIRTLEPWFDLLGNNPLGDVASGTVRGDLDVTVEGTGEQIRCKGALDLNGLVGKRGHSFPGPGPLSVRTRAEGTVAGLREITIMPSSVKLYRAEDLLVSAGVTGQVETGEGRLDLKVDLHSDSLPRTLGSLDLLPDISGIKLQGGGIRGRCAVVVNGADHGIRMTGQISLKDLRADLTDGRSMEQSLEVKGDVGIRDSGAVIRVRDLSVRESTATGAARHGHSRGEVSASGILLLKDHPGDKKGTLDVRVDNLSMAPWLAFLGKPAPAGLGALPLQARLTMEQDPAFKRITVKGTEEVSLPSDPEKPTGRQVRVHISNRIEQDGKGGAVFQAELSSSRGKGDAPDQWTLNGTYRKALQEPGNKPALRLALHIRHLDAGIYLDPLLGKKEPEPPQVPGQENLSEEAGPDTPPLQALESSLNDLPLDLDVQATVDRFLLHNLSVEALKANLKAEEGGLRVNMPSARIAGGTYRARFEFSPGPPSRGLLWDAAGSKIDLGALMAAFQEDEASTTSGTLSFETRCQGNASPGGKLEESLKGALNLELTHGRFGQFSLHDFVAKSTGVNAFRRMAFDLVHANVEISDGHADLKNVYVTGSAARLVARGSVSLQGDLDVAITPYLMPGLSSMVKEVKLASSLMKTVEGFLLIPVDIRVHGPYDHLKFSARPIPGHLLKQGGSVLKGVIGGVVHGGVSFVEDTVREGPVRAVGSRLKKGGEITVDTVKGSGRLVGGTVEKTVEKTEQALTHGAGRVRQPGEEDSEPRKGFFRGIFGGKKGKDGDPDAPEETKEEEAPEPPPLEDSNDLQ